MMSKNTAGRPGFPEIFVILALLLILPGAGGAEEMDGVVEHETGIYYTVKEGDTLWDLSRRFADSPWMWPDMWKDNRHIANPHEIYPGDRIRLYRRKDAERFLDTDALEMDETPGAMKIPRKTYRYPGIDQVGFLRETPVTPVGSIIREHNRLLMIHSGQRVYIQPNGDARLAPGGLYTVYRTIGRVRSPRTGKDLGTQHLILGVVEILLEEPALYVATVTKSFRRMRNGDLLMPYRKRSEDFTLSRGPMGISASIISPEEDQLMISTDNIAFIDRGERDGVRPGQLYYSYAVEKITNRMLAEVKAGLIPPPLKSGELVVLLAERTTATVVIIQSDDNIVLGSAIGVPP